MQNIIVADAAISNIVTTMTDGNSGTVGVGEVDGEGDEVGVCVDDGVGVGVGIGVGVGVGLGANVADMFVAPSTF